MHSTTNGKAEPALKRRLGVFSATLAGVGVILGAGIYVLIGEAAGEAGNAVWLSFAFAAVGACLTAFSYARLVKLRPKNAPEFQYVNMAFGSKPAFLAGWLMLWAAVISAAAVALGFAGYLQHWLGTPYVLSAVGLIVVSSLIVFIGIGESAIMAGILTLVEAAGLVIVISIGLPHLGDVNLMEMTHGATGIIEAASLIFFAFLGFEGIANLSEEMKNPERDLPRAIMIALGVSAVLYIMVAFGAVSVVGWEKLSQSGAPLAVVAQTVLGPKAELLMTAIALASTANTVLLMLLAASRAMWAMSCAGVLPGAFCVIGENRQTPWKTILVVGISASLFALMGDIGSVADMTNFAVLLAFAAVNASALKLFYREDANRPVKRIALNICLPASGSVVSLLLAATTGWRAALLGAGLLAVGLVVARIMQRTSGGRTL